MISVADESLSLSKTESSQVKGLIFDIQRYSIQDGPGIRTTVFFKGCPLTCLWCSNPESQSRRPQLIYNEQLCTRCYRCVEACQAHAIQAVPGETPQTDRELCQACGACVEACLGEARTISGRWMSVDEVVQVVIKDEKFYRNSGGGVTASGGEPTSQAGFLLALFQECRKRVIHTTLETCGFAKWETLDKILPYLDLVLYDVKHLDPVRHQELTGVGNQLILENARRIAQSGVPLIIRVPLIPGCNDDTEHMRGIAEFALELGGVEVNLLPYHRFGLAKYKGLGLDYKLNGADVFNGEQLAEKVAVIESCGLSVTVV